MLGAVEIILAGLLPLLPAAGLLALAEWRDQRRATALARQVRLTDAITAKLGAVVAPVVSKPLAGLWRVEMRVSVARPALVSRIIAIAHDTLRELGIARYELVLTPQPTPMRASSRSRGWRDACGWRDSASAPCATSPEPTKGAVIAGLWDESVMARLSPVWRRGYRRSRLLQSNTKRVDSSGRCGAHAVDLLLIRASWSMPLPGRHGHLRTPRRESATWRPRPVRGAVQGARLREPAHCAPPEAVNDMIVDHSDGLHERVADGRANEAETALDQVATEGFRDVRL